LITRLDLRRTEKYEGWLIDQFDHVLVTSSADRQALISLSNSDKAPLNITILPNGVDLNYFQPNPSALREPNTLVVSGKMSYHANIAMVRFLVREIMPLVWSRHPDVKLNIIGKDPPGEILAMGDDSRVMISGTVPDLRIYLQTASIAVAPIIYGVGIQNKVLEAMACQTPVVASPQAVSALNILPGQDAFVADGADAFANAIITLIEQPDLRRQVSINGYQYVREKHNWTDITLQLEDIYRKSNKRTIH
jgi:glycosyltransferase involved in cell wall biosynthesis